VAQRNLLREHPLAKELRVREEGGTWGFRIWQHGTGPIEGVASAAIAQAKREFCHRAAVEAGLVKRAQAWPWSSLQVLDRREPGAPRVRTWAPDFYAGDCPETLMMR
jgi:hypothetical protein